MSDHRVTLEERLQSHPRLRARVEALVAIVEETSPDQKTADEAEWRIIEEVRQLGHELLYEWAVTQEVVHVEACRAQYPTMVGHGTKKLHWYTTFGEIMMRERVFWYDRHFLRPFTEAADVTCRGYSRPLQRRITDFGADVAFGRVVDKLEEHYGVRIPESAARTITEFHAQAIHGQQQACTAIPERAGVACLIAETDGTMIPLVETSDPVSNGRPIDRRKTRTCRWHEARLTLTHPKGVMAPVFGGTLGGPDDAGEQLLTCAIRSGLGSCTHVHCVGDGAPWIADQATRVFGKQGTFLIDVSHLRKYLSAASRPCAPAAQDACFLHYQDLMRDNRVAAVLEDLKPHREAASVPDEKAPVRCCSRSIANRPGQFDYKGALANDLPIGSGDIERGHRSLIHKRLKLAGAWWKEDQAQHMLALRILRANGHWERYWKESNKDNKTVSN